METTIQNQMDADVSKLVKIIESCATKEQFESSARMIDLFISKWKTSEDFLTKRRADSYAMYLFGFQVGYENAFITHVHKNKK